MTNDDFNSIQTLNFELLMEGDFILCNFMGGKRNQTKLCVQEKEPLINVMGLRSTDKAKKEFVPNEHDISSIRMDQIISKVLNPQI